MNFESNIEKYNLAANYLLNSEIVGSTLNSKYPDYDHEPSRVFHLISSDNHTFDLPESSLATMTKFLFDLYSKPFISGYSKETLDKSGLPETVLICPTFGSTILSQYRKVS